MTADAARPSTLILATLIRRTPSAHHTYLRVLLSQGAGRVTSTLASLLRQIVRHLVAGVAIALGKAGHHRSAELPLPGSQAVIRPQRPRQPAVKSWHNVLGKQLKALERLLSIGPIVGEDQEGPKAAGGIGQAVQRGNHVIRGADD